MASFEATMVSQFRRQMTGGPKRAYNRWIISNLVVPTVPTGALKHESSSCSSRGRTWPPIATRSRTMWSTKASFVYDFGSPDRFRFGFVDDGAWRGARWGSALVVTKRAKAAICGSKAESLSFQFPCKFKKSRSYRFVGGFGDLCVFLS